MNKLYTWGYLGSRPEDLAYYINALHAWLVDIRFNPVSRRPEWNQVPLMQLSSHGYAYIAALGNRNYKGAGPIELAKPEASLDVMRHTLSHQPAILLCACKQLETCHRKVAAEYLAEKLGVDVEHLPGRFEDWLQSRQAA